MFAIAGDYANTIAGAITPVIVLVCALLVKRLERRLKGAHQESQHRLAEAEALIRGDLKNGVKKSIDEVNEKLDEAVVERKADAG